MTFQPLHETVPTNLDDAEPWGIRDDFSGFKRTFATEKARDDFYELAKDRYVLPTLFGPKPVAASPAPFTEQEVRDLTAMIWGAPCHGRDLHAARAVVRAMELLNGNERPQDPSRGGRLLDIPENLL